MKTILVTGADGFIGSHLTEVYGTDQYVPIDERHPLHRNPPYSVTKIAADAMAMSFITRLFCTV